MMEIKHFFQQRIAIFTILSVVAGLGITAGCAKKPLALHPPQVQSTTQSGGGASQTASASAARTTGETMDSATGGQSDQWLVGIEEETLTESGAVAPSSGSKDSSSKMAMTADGSRSGAGESSTLGAAMRGKGSRFGGAGAPVVGKGSRSGGLGDFASGRAKKGGKVRMSKMLPFRSTRALDDVHFQFDKYDLDATSKAILQKNAQWLKQHPGVKLEIQGHTDERGTNNYNLGLGERRAQSVKNYLLALGIDKSRLFAISYGEEKPFCLESKENCWWQNRRGHFMVSAPRNNRGEVFGMLP